MAVLSIVIVFLSLVALLILHELGHFLVAKKVGMRVEEFGIGYPPRVFGKKIGETVYSLNLLPFGAFVKIEGEEGESISPRSFSAKPVWQRMLVAFAGVASFFIVSYLIFTFLIAINGLTIVVPENEHIDNSFVEIVYVSPNSLAERIGLVPGDKIKKACFGKECFEIKKTDDFLRFISRESVRPVEIYIQRGKNIKKIRFFLPPKQNQVKNQPVLGIAVVDVAHKKVKWWQAPFIAGAITVDKIVQIPTMLAFVVKEKLAGRKVEGVEMVGPIGIGAMMSKMLQTGLGNYFSLLAMISLWLALFNLIPLPALDGGKMLFLLIEAVRKKPVSKKIEQNASSIVFLVLIVLMVVVTIKDILRLF